MNKMNSKGAVMNTIDEPGTLPPLSEHPDSIPQAELIDEKQLAGAIERLLGAAQHKTVFGEPVVVGQYTIITACEVSSAGGFGFGSGPVASPTKEVAGKPAMSGQFTGILMGNGGAGGGASGRPIAVIIAGPDGVTVKPIVDVTKFMITFFTAWKVVASAAFLAWRKVAPIRFKYKTRK